MRILISGINGQLGQALIKKEREDFEVMGLGKDQFNLENFEGCKKLISNYQPDWIINSAAYTAVDQAETHKSKAYLVNSYGVENIVKSISEYGGKFLHISTDFVFDGKETKPYLPSDKCNPVNVYGASKLKGEQLLKKYKNTIILRTSWLYGPKGHNFCLTMLKLHKKFSENNSSFKVISDQIGCPTSTEDLANICWKFVDKCNSEKFSTQIYHWSNSGIATWYDFAVAIGELGSEYGLIKKPAKIIPISTKEYKTDARRPKFSLMDCNKTKEFLNVNQNHWRDSLREVISSISHEEF